MKHIQNWLKQNSIQSDRVFKQLKLFLVLKYSKKNIPNKVQILLEYADWSRVVNQTYQNKTLLEELAFNLLDADIKSPLQNLIQHHLAKENFIESTKYTDDIDLLAFYYQKFCGEPNVKNLNQTSIDITVKNGILNLIKNNKPEACVFFINRHYNNKLPVDELNLFKAHATKASILDTYLMNLPLAA